MIRERPEVIAFAPFLSHHCHGLGNGSIAFIRKLPTVQARYLVGNYTEQEEKTRAQPEAGVLAASLLGVPSSAVVPSHSPPIFPTLKSKNETEKRTVTVLRDSVS